MSKAILESTQQRPIGSQQKEAAAKVIDALLSWYRVHGRHELPWRKTRDPYRVLVSELMLQQTQVRRVIPKYEAFIARFPTMADLAAADRRDLLLLWQGLGYNSRAVRLHALAKAVRASGAMPDTIEELRSLPGIGPYTAGAVMIFAYDTPAASVDVNVSRVLSRIFVQPDTTPRPDELQDLASTLITMSGKPHNWQSALMDFGSGVCTAREPRCVGCPLRTVCKTRGIRPQEQQQEKQPAFYGSSRWWRGQILKHLLQGQSNTTGLLDAIKDDANADDAQRFEAALRTMAKEGLIVVQRGRCSLA